MIWWILLGIWLSAGFLRTLQLRLEPVEPFNYSLGEWIFMTVFLCPLELIVRLCKLIFGIRI